MRGLLAQVNDKEEADSFRTALDEAKLKAKDIRPSGRNNLLFGVVTDKEKDAADAYNKSDFSGAKTLYKILHRIFALNMSCDDDEECIEALQESIENLREEADNVNALKFAPWFYEQAEKAEQDAIDLFNKEDYRGAAEYFIQSAFLYEKAKMKAESMKKS